MNKKYYILIYVLSLGYFFIVSLFQKTPGYMDASYYYVSGSQLASGNGATEPFIWNFLNDPQAIPNHAFTYWMPLSSLIAALGMWITGNFSFMAARLPFIFLAALLPATTAWYVAKKTKIRLYWVIAVLLSLFCGSYLPFLTITETFTPFFILGAIYLGVSNKILDKEPKNCTRFTLFMVLGVTSGAMHLTRADGVLWLVGGVFSAAMLFYANRKEKSVWKKLISNIGCLIAGYFAVMSGWFIRNIYLYGNFFPDGSNLAIWFTKYDDLFVYPSSVLTYSRFIENGWQSILQVRGMAALTNLETLLGVAGNVVLFPFILIGVWIERQRPITKLVFVILGLLFILMTVVFPYAGGRGGFFHSISALQIFFWVTSIVGIEETVHWTVRHLQWVENKARTLLAVVLVLGVMSMTCITFINRVTPSITKWDSKYESFSRLDTHLSTLSMGDDYSIMVNDAPGFYLVSQQRSIQLSSGSINSTAHLMDIFGINYLVVDSDVPDSLLSFIEEPGDQHGLRLIGKFEEYFIYSLE